MIPVVHILTTNGEGEYESAILRLKDIRGAVAVYHESELKNARTANQAKVIDVEAGEAGATTTRSIKFQTTTDQDVEVDIDTKTDCVFEIHLAEILKEGDKPYLQTRNLPLFLGTLIGVLTKG